MPRRAVTGRNLDPAALHVVGSGSGCRLHLRVQPGARRSAILAVQGDALKVSVTAPPERGRANGEVVELLADALGVARRRVEIVSGQASRRKTVHVEGLDPAEIRERLRGCGTRGRGR